MMTRERLLGWFLGLLCLQACVCGQVEVGGEAASPQGIPSIKAVSGAFVTEMLILGPFPHPAPIKELDRRGGYDTDYLISIGGEANPRIHPDMVVSYTTPEGKTSRAVTTYVKIMGGKTLDWKPLFRRNTSAVAYGLVNIEAETDMDMTCLFGSDDFAKVWLNGELVHQKYQGDGSRGLTPGEDIFPLKLRKGPNRFLVKVDQHSGGWGMSAEFLDKAGYEAFLKQKAQAKYRNRFAANALRIDKGFEWWMPNRLVGAGPVEAITFENPELAEQILDLTTMKVRWFDSRLNEVEKIETPGFYCAYVEAKGKNALPYRRMLAAYFLTDFWMMGNAIEHDLQSVPFAWKQGNATFRETSWNQHRALLQNTVGSGFWTSFDHDLAPLWCGEMTLDNDPQDAWRISPYSHMQDYFVRLRRKILNRPEAKMLPLPVADASATALRNGTEAEAGFKAGAVEKMRAAFSQWRDQTGIGFVVVVARHGVVVMHEAFPGKNDADHLRPDELKNGLMSISTPMETASVTKLHAGIILGRLIDQGWVHLDDPVAKYFPDFPAEGPMAVTVRQLMNHTSGLEGHLSWTGFDGMVNPFLENVALWSLEGKKPGTVWNYNGFGIDLGGKVVEDVTGQSVFTVMRDGLFAPLGQDRPTISDLGYSLKCTAMDLARVAEMLRQEGAYDGKRYLRKETFRTLLPLNLGLHNPAMAGTIEEYGVGISWMRDPTPVEPETVTSAEPSSANAITEDAATMKEEILAGGEGKGKAEESYLLGRNVFGHGSATGAVLRVAPDLGLIVTMTRYTPGPDYSEHLARCIQTVADQLDVK